MGCKGGVRCIVLCPRTPLATRVGKQGPMPLSMWHGRTPTPLTVCWDRRQEHLVLGIGSGTNSWPGYLRARVLATRRQGTLRPPSRLQTPVRQERAVLPDSCAAGSA